MTPRTNPIRLHGAATFDRGGKARWLLTEMNLPYEDHWLDRKTKEQESPAYLKLNPMGRVPTAEIGDQVMFESGAICAYLADLHPEKEMAPALTAPERAHYQQWMYFASATIDAIQGKIMIIEDIPPGEVQTKKEKALQEELRDSLEALDRTLSKNSFLVGNRFTAADICVTYQLFWLRLWPELNSEFEAFPRVGAYLDRMIARPAAQSSKAFAYEG